MKFSKLSQYFERLEKTSSRLSLIEILADLFKNTPKEEIDKICYLIQGRLAPFFVPLEIGIKKKNVAKAIASAFGVNPEEVTRQFNS
ncbi:MAG: DNA ligase, partial [Candidatus Levybacteria bacterium]|nr:DNA ligase [Candidatus Levybacteria bacterium]